MRPLLFVELVLDMESRSKLWIRNRTLLRDGLNAEPCAMMEVRLMPLIITLSKLEVMIIANRMMLTIVRQ